MATTNHLGITLVEQAQSQKEVTVNQAFTRLDAILNSGAKSRTTNTPPGSPATGDLYIVGTSRNSMPLCLSPITWEYRHLQDRRY